MFSGIIKAITPITSFDYKNGSLFLTIQKPAKWKIGLGDSIATNGVCLTVKKLLKKEYVTELMLETLEKTTFGQEIPRQVNVEQSLALGSMLDGHIVQGHVDGVGEIIKITSQGAAKVYRFSFPTKFSKLIAEKGAITVDGVSLTVVEVGARWFSVSLVDYTLTHTVLGSKCVGDVVNLEFDVLAKYLARLISKK